LITVDTYRIAAVEQLKTLCRDHRPALAGGDDPVEMPAGTRTTGVSRGCFIDTAGRSPRDEVKIRELSRVHATGPARRSYLVLSASRRPSQPAIGLERFSTVQVDRLILTKLDEADSLGGVLAVLGLFEPAGQLFDDRPSRSPTTFEPADRKRLARLILKQENLD